MGILDFVKRGIFLPKSSTCLFCGGEIKNGQCTKCRQVCEICKKGLSREDITISCFECHSTYHVNELDDWYQTGKPCPVCRENLREEFQNYEARGPEQWSSKYQLLFTIQDYAKVNPVYTRHFLVGFFVLLTTAIFDLNLGWFPLEWPQLLLFSLTVIILPMIFLTFHNWLDSQMRISTIRSLNTSIEFKGVIVSLSLPFVLGRILNGFGLINGDTILYVMILVSTLLLITIRHSISSQIGGKEQDGIMLLTSVVILFSVLYVIFFVEFGDFMYDETMGTLFVTHNILSILAILYIPYKRPELVANRDSDWDEHFLNRTATVMLFTILLINSIRLIGFTGITGIFILLIVATGIVRSLFIYNPNSLKYKAISSVIVFELITILITIMMYIDQFSPNLI